MVEPEDFVAIASSKLFCLFDKEIILLALFTYIYIHYISNKKWNDQSFKKKISLFCKFYTLFCNFQTLTLLNWYFCPYVSFQQHYGILIVTNWFFLWCDHRLSINMVSLKCQWLCSFQIQRCQQKAGPNEVLCRAATNCQAFVQRMAKYGFDPISAWTWKKLDIWLT